MTLIVHAQPGAKSSAIAGLHGDALKIRVAAPAVDNKANAALLVFLSGALGTRSATMRIRHGTKGRRKTIEIVDADHELVTRVQRLIQAFMA